MLYLNGTDIRGIGFNWNELIKVIGDSVEALHNKDYSQPIKPYLRYGDPKNRIIAMPAYVGGKEALAGIKWIASFPDNIHKNKPRAHSVTILNESHSGIPLCVINTALVSAIRTASLSGLMIKEFLKTKQEKENYKVGIIGFGPIGRMHLKMITSILGERIDQVLLYDINSIDYSNIENEFETKISVADTWQDCYEEADIFITSTVADQPYINKKPKKNSLQLNISLRDYKAEMRKYMDVIIVDDWDEVCRQNTDIENMHKLGLKKDDTLSIIDVVCKGTLLKKKADAVTMFNPMGMAVFDIAIGGYYFREAMKTNTGINLAD